ncbi:MAG TPA: hypothetical protein VF316_03355 [Polyangiaceae bacterium]
MHSALCGFVVLALLGGCHTSKHGDWGADCDPRRDDPDDCRAGLHCSVLSASDGRHYCTALCTESAAHPCAALGAPSGWSCLAIADPRDGECRDPRRGMPTR